MEYKYKIYRWIKKNNIKKLKNDYLFLMNKYICHRLFL